MKKLAKFLALFFVGGCLYLYCPPAKELMDQIGTQIGMVLVWLIVFWCIIDYVRRA